MIGKAKSNKSLAATIEYNLKEQAELCFTNKLTGNTMEEYQMQMQDLQKCYSGYAKQLTIHAILSPHISEGKNLSVQQWRQIADEYLEQMDLKEHQAVGFIHCDKEHRHLHLVINKVDEQTLKQYKDSFIGKRSQKAADRIAEKMGLIRAMEIKKKNLQTRQQQAKDIKDEEKAIKPLGAKQLFKQELQAILVNKDIKSVNDYFKEIERAGFKLHQYHNKETQELRGYGIEKNRTKLDASAIGKEFTLKNVLPLFENNKRNMEKRKSQKLKLNISVQEDRIEASKQQWKMKI